jgi:hypothetical protein
MVTEFGGYIRANAEWIPNYGERHRADEAISNAFVESAVNQVVSKRVVKKQQMRDATRCPPPAPGPDTRAQRQSSERPSTAGIRNSCPP